jgi:hypothetical protein
MIMHCFCSLIALLVAPTLAQGQPEIIEVRKIWDGGGHNAFTDLIRFRDAWFLAFREGSAHVSPDGAIRILTSADGRDWTTTAIGDSDADLRDPKLSVTPDGRLFLIAAAVRKKNGVTTHQSMAWTSADGRIWSVGRPIGEKDVWLWRVDWQGDDAFGVGYATTPPHLTRLYKGSADGPFEPIVPALFDAGFPNESDLEFLPDGTALCLLRRDGEKGGKADDRSAQLGRSRPPYTEWTWTDLKQPIGGPALRRLPDGRIVAGVRLLDGKVRTALCWLDPDSGKLDEFLTLPSGGDTSYPGLVWHDDQLWVSYYSSHEGKTSIYLARIKVPSAETP